MDLEAELDTLYAAAADRFVSERDALVKRLRAAGDREAATRVKALRRPTVPAWAVNQLRWRHPKLLGELQRAGARLRSSAVGDYGEATGAQRALVRELVEAARPILEAGGHAVEPNAERVRELLTSLSAWGTEPPTEPGRLVDKIPAPDLDQLLSSPPPRPRPKLVPEPEEEDEEDEEEEEEAEAEDEEAAERREEARAEAVFLRRKLVRQEREVEVADGKAERAQERVERAQRALEEAEEDLETVTDGAKAARKAVKETQAALEEAEGRAE